MDRQESTVFAFDGEDDESADERGPRDRCGGLREFEPELLHGESADSRDDKGEGDLAGEVLHGGRAPVRRHLLQSRPKHDADGEDGANVVFSRTALRYVARVMKPRSLRKLSEAHAAALALGRLVKKSHCQSAIGAAVGPTGGNLATDTHVAERLSTGSNFSSNGRNVI